MINGEKYKCLLCDYPAERVVFKDPQETSEVARAGYKYECPECGFYAFDNDVHSWLENFGIEEHKKKLSQYIKNNPDEKGDYKYLNRTQVEKIINVTIPKIQWGRLR